MKTYKAKQKIHAWLVANDPNFMDKAAAEKLMAENATALALQNQGEQRKVHKKGTKTENRQENSNSKKVEKVRIGNTSNFMVTFAQCCRPKYPDPIVGYVSRYKGITVHKASCPTFQRIQSVENRTIDVQWDVDPNE